MKSFLIRKFLDKDFSFFFGFFLGTIFLSAIAMVAFSLTDAFIADVEEYRNGFQRGYMIEVNSSEYLSDLEEKDVLILSEGEEGLTYGVTISFGEKSKYISYSQHGFAVRKLLQKMSAETSLREDEIWLSYAIAEEFDCKEGDTVYIDGRSYRYVDSLYSLGDYFYVQNALFALYSNRDSSFESFSAVFTNMDEALAFSEKVTDPTAIEDKNGVLVYYKGMKFLRNVFVAFACFVALICVLYYAVTISIYLMRKTRSSEILRAFGGPWADYAFSVASSFSIVSFCGTVFGLLMAVGLRLVIDFWAIEIIGMSLNPTSFLLLFGSYLVGSVVAIGVLTFVISRRVNRDSVVFC